MDMSSSPGLPHRATYPDPYIVPPTSGAHKQTFIILHGRGDSGEVFGSYLLMHHIPELQDLRTAFPDAQFVFPTASQRRALVLKDCMMNQLSVQASFHLIDGPMNGLDATEFDAYC